jgi:hypothetical protein
MGKKRRGINHRGTEDTEKKRKTKRKNEEKNSGTLIFANQH